MKLFKEYIIEEQQPRPTKLGDLVKVGTNMQDADFWITRRGSIDKVGHPSKDFNKEHFGVKVTRPDVLDPRYAYYMMQHIANTGHYKQHAVGSTNLVNIRAEHIINIPLGR